MSCMSCVGADCLDNLGNAEPITLYDLHEGQMFFNDTYCFVLGCPAGYICSSPGLYPRQICIINRTLPPIIINGQQISLKCCQKTLYATIPAGTDQAHINAIVQGLFAECARQQAYCINITTGPGNNPPPRPNPLRPPNQRVLQFIGAPGDACIGSAYSATIKVVGGNGALMFGMVSGTLPPGLFPASGVDGQSFVLQGTPSQAGNFTFTIEASDQSGNSIQKAFTVSIRGISNLAALPSAVENTPYSYQLQGSGGVPPYTFAISVGSLPSGLSLSSSGLISGTPDYATAGDYGISWQINDSGGNSCIQDKSMHVALRPGPNWLNLVWDLYGTSNGIPPSAASGSASGNVATGNVALVNQGGPPWPHIFPVHASIPGGYTGPQVTTRMRLTVSYAGNTSVTSVMALLRNAIQLGGIGCTAASGTIQTDIVIPISVGATIEIQDLGGGAEWAELNNILTTGTLSFTLVIFNL